jgi:hypothetical protein
MSTIINEKNMENISNNDINMSTIINEKNMENISNNNINNKYQNPKYIDLIVKEKVSKNIYDSFNILFEWILEVINENIWYQKELINEDNDLYKIRKYIYNCTKNIFRQLLKQLKYTIKINTTLQCIGTSCLIVALKYVLAYDWEDSVNYLKLMEERTNYSSTKKEIYKYEIYIVLNIDWNLIKTK